MADSHFPFDAAAPAGGMVCAACRQPIRGQYFTSGPIPICPPCRAQIASQIAPQPNLPRAVLYGIAAAMAGAAAYYAVLSLTGLSIGLVAVGVGYLVGRAVFQGSGRHGGRGCQVLAAALTYLAIAACYVPGGNIALAAAGPLMAGIASPILLIIFGFGIWEAWRLNRGRALVWAGPFHLRGDAE